jgi:predicted Zn-dependent peptidase
MFESHPYRWSTIGSMEHLDTTLEDFKDFHKKFYIPNNAVLVVAGDFEKNQAKDGWIENTLALSKRRSTKSKRLSRNR